MKPKSLTAPLLALALLLACLAPRASAQVTLQSLFSDLVPYGQWTQLGSYGAVWEPNVSDPDWTPYSVGHWAYTDYGWTWVSDEPWGWITYHYGRWVDFNQSWYWVPGTAWAPAWVGWRYGGGYCGWVPLPPRGHPFPSRGYRFVRVGSLGASSLRGAYLNRTGNRNYLHLTASVGGIASGPDGLRRLSGPPLAAVNAASPHPIRQLHLQVGGQTGAGTSHNSAVVGDSLHVYAPRIGGAAHPPIAAAASFHPGAPATPPSAPVHNFASAPFHFGGGGGEHLGGGGGDHHGSGGGHSGGGEHREGGASHPGGGGGEHPQGGGNHPGGGGGGGHPGGGGGHSGGGGGHSGHR